MKVKITALLRSKFDGVNEQIISRIAEKLAAKTTTNTTEEELKTIVEGTTFQQVIDSHADYRATQATQSAVANYEAKYGLKEGRIVKTEEPTPAPASLDGLPPELAGMFKEMMASQKSMAQELAALKGVNVISSRKQKLDTILDGLTELQRAPYSRLKLDAYSEEEFASELESLTAEAEKIRVSNKQYGVIVTPPKDARTPPQEKGKKEDGEALAKSLDVK